MKIKDLELEWLGHAGFLITASEKRIYIDPYQISKTSPDADYIFITHDHYDHLSVEDIDAITSEDTLVICPPSCYPKINHLPREAVMIKRGQTKEVDDITVTAIPAYNEGKPFHEKDTDWVGYVLEIDGVRIYHTGDADNIPEMEGVEADVALVPVSGKYVMNAQEAAKAVKKMKVKKAVPMHYGALIGDESDAEAFKKASSVPVTILKKTVF